MTALFRRRVTLAGYATTWLDTRTQDPATIEAHAVRLRAYLLPGLGRSRLRKLTPGAVQAWLASLTGRGLSPATVAAAASTLRQVCAAAKDEKLITANPFDALSVTLPPRGRRTIVPWTGAQVAAVRRNLPPRYAAMADIGAYLGLRQGEVFALALTDVDVDGSTIHVRRQVKRVNGQLVFAPPKGGRDRTLPMSPHVRQVIACHVLAFPAATVTLPWRTPDGKPHTVVLMFARPDGSPCDRSDFNRRCWKPALVSAGIDPSRGNGMHQLRHHFASQLARRGADVETIRDLLGHASVATTASYIHSLTGATGPAARAAVAKLAQPPRPRGRKPPRPDTNPPRSPDTGAARPGTGDSGAFADIAGRLADVEAAYRLMLDSYPERPADE